MVSRLHKVSKNGFLDYRGQRKVGSINPGLSGHSCAGKEPSRDIMMYLNTKT